MAVKLRLRRLGRKGVPYYHVVAADARSPRDGKYIEQLGVYDPTKNPAVVEVDEAKAIQWLKNGAQPTDTVRAILKYSGITLKYALIKQGKDQETIDRIWNKWWDDRQSRVSSKVTGLEQNKRQTDDTKLKQEGEIRVKRAARIVEKNTPPQAQVQVEVEAPAAETEAEAPAENA